MSESRVRTLRLLFSATCCVLMSPSAHSDEQTAASEVLAILKAIDVSRQQMPFADVEYESHIDIYDGVLSGSLSAPRDSLLDSRTRVRNLTDGVRALVKFDRFRPGMKQSEWMSERWAYDGEFLRIDPWGDRPDPAGEQSMVGQQFEVGAMPLDQLRDDEHYGALLAPMLDYRYVGIWNRSLESSLGMDQKIRRGEASDSLESGFGKALSVDKCRSMVEALPNPGGSSQICRVVVESAVDPPVGEDRSAFQHVLTIDTGKHLILSQRSKYAPTVAGLINPDRVYELNTEWKPRVDPNSGKEWWVADSMVFTLTVPQGVAQRSTARLVSITFVTTDQLPAEQFSWRAMGLQPGRLADLDPAIGNVLQWDGYQFSTGLPVVK